MLLCCCVVLLNYALSVEFAPIFPKMCFCFPLYALTLSHPLSSIPDIPPTASYPIAAWRGITFLWAILALSGTWYQPRNGQSYSLWDGQTPTSSDSDAARAFTIFTFMFSAFQVSS